MDQVTAPEGGSAWSSQDACGAGGRALKASYRDRELERALGRDGCWTGERLWNWMG